MAHQSDLIAEDIHAYLKAQEEKSLLRFITCGSVDDGKSTLIGRLLWDSKMIFEDQLAALEADSRRVGTQGEKIDYALLLDGLQAEREQGITIDVAYRFFSTDKRKFIVADTPGHEQYTRNMVTGASTAQVAVILIDARKGILTQTRRHSYLVSLVGIRQVLLAVNKMDLVDYSQARFEAIRDEYAAFAEALDFEQVTAIPISALEGDHILSASANTPWYQGAPLMEYLESVQISDESDQQPFRLAVQWVNRPNLDFRGYCGTVASGRIRPGDTIAVASSGKTSRVTRIVSLDGDLSEATAGQAVTLTLADEIDISRGDLLSATENRPQTTDHFQAHLVWLHEEALLPGRSYLLKIGANNVPAQVSEVRYKVNVNSLQQEPGKTLALNEVGMCVLSVDKPIPFDPYRDNRATGNFILIDRLSNATVGAGMIDAPLERAKDSHWQQLDIDKQAHAALKGQRPRVLWFTGLPGSGKSTLANLVEKKLHSLGRHTYILDGDNLRHGINRNLGYNDADQVEHIRRVAEMTKVLVDAGLIVLVALVSPFRRERTVAREMLEADEFYEIFVDTPLELCEQRDARGVFQKARAGELKHVAGIDTLYETPEAPEIVVDGRNPQPEELALQIIRQIFGDPNAIEWYI
ncbi:MAG: sulfate adenylyltransferase subunit CysN [Desulfuromonadaceae bacterium]